MGAYTPNDGHTDPSGITNAMAAGAKMHGAEIIRQPGHRHQPTGEWGRVVTEKELYHVNTWSMLQVLLQIRQGMVGLKIPMVNMVHQYLVAAFR